MGLPTIEQLMQFYFWATMRGWVSGEDHEIIESPLRPELAKGYTVPGRDEFFGLLYTDTFWTRSNDRNSGGVTLIFHDNDIVWMMGCAGRYEEEATPVVMAAIRKAMEDKVFLGGRGKGTFRHEGLLYHNNPTVTVHSTFAQFHGYEGVTRAGVDGECLGEHTYWGRLVMPVD